MKIAAFRMYEYNFLLVYEYIVMQNISSLYRKNKLILMQINIYVEENNHIILCFNKIQIDYEIIYSKS